MPFSNLTRAPLKLLCDTMKYQIISRAFYGCECKHLSFCFSPFVNSSSWHVPTVDVDQSYQKTFFLHRACVLSPSFHSPNTPFCVGQHHYSWPWGTLWCSRRPLCGGLGKVPQRQLCKINTHCALILQLIPLFFYVREIIEKLLFSDLRGKGNTPPRVFWWCGPITKKESLALPFGTLPVHHDWEMQAGGITCSGTWVNPGLYSSLFTLVFWLRLMSRCGQCMSRLWKSGRVVRSLSVRGRGRNMLRPSHDVHPEPAWKEGPYSGTPPSVQMQVLTFLIKKKQKNIVRIDKTWTGTG